MPSLNAQPYNTRIELMNLITDPSTQSADNFLPVTGVPHDDFPALGVVVGDSHLHHVLGTFDAQRFVNFKFDRKAVGVPAETSFHVEPALMGITSDNILNRTSQNVAVVREAGRKRRPVIESVSEIRNTTVMKI